jgi:hypothetical protein
MSEAATVMQSGIALIESTTREKLKSIQTLSVTDQDQ